jgi:predicted O-methyltransferase YrrM
VSGVGFHFLLAVNVSFQTKARLAANRLLARLNIQIGTLTAKRREDARLGALADDGYFSRPTFALSPGMEGFDAAAMIAALAAFGEDLARLKSPATNSVGYVANSHYSSPDTDVLYLMIRLLKPARLIEIGCGNSTRIIRQAIRDGGLNTKLIAIDPQPRQDITELVDHIQRERLEFADRAAFEALVAGDVLFIDSSHLAAVGNDVVHLFGDIIPRLPKGVVVHVHDIFLPFDYPAVGDRYGPVRATWSEQYVLHALLHGGQYVTLWPGHYLQKARPDVTAALPFMLDGVAQSYWFQT